MPNSKERRKFRRALKRAREYVNTDNEEGEGEEKISDSSGMTNTDAGKPSDRKEKAEYSHHPLHYVPRMKYRAIVAWWKAVTHDQFNVFFTFVIAVATVIYAIISNSTLTEIKTQGKIAQDSLQISQRAYVTIGRKDGVVADFVVPKDPKQNAEIVIYFQNSGHLPAKFAWGTMIGFLGEGSKKKSGITYAHPYQGLSFRKRDKKTGSEGQEGESSMIAGDSVFVSTLGTISQEDLISLPSNDPSLLVLGFYDYCDELGNQSKRTFALRYRANAPSSTLSFDLAYESDSLATIPPPATATIEYLPPCKSVNEQTKK
jgi:hypothetical protein